VSEGFVLLKLLLLFNFDIKKEAKRQRKLSNRVGVKMNQIAYIPCGICGPTKETQATQISYVHWRCPKSSKLAMYHQRAKVAKKK
jgi:hypothetical protein